MMWPALGGLMRAALAGRGRQWPAIAAGRDAPRQMKMSAFGPTMGGGKQAGSFGHIYAGSPHTAKACDDKISTSRLHCFSPRGRGGAADMPRFRPRGRDRRWPAISTISGMSWLAFAGDTDCDYFRTSASMRRFSVRWQAAAGRHHLGRAPKNALMMCAYRRAPPAARRHDSTPLAEYRHASRRSINCRHGARHFSAGARCCITLHSQHHRQITLSAQETDELVAMLLVDAKARR